MNSLLPVASIVLAVGLCVAPASNGQATSERDERPARGESSKNQFELLDGDRVVLLGSGFIEAAQEFGYLELALTTRWPDRNVAFRNVGWSGDTVFGEARAHFTNPPSPYERLLDEATAPDPTVIFVGYGSTVPFEVAVNGSLSAGEAPEQLQDALARFEEGLRRLIGDLEAETDARLILLSPPPLEADRSPAPSEYVRQTNAALKAVSDVIARVADERGHRFVDVHDGLAVAEREIDSPITVDGVQLNAAGYYHLARIVEEGLGLPPRRWSVRADAASDAVEAGGARILDLKASGLPAGPVERLRRLITEKNRLYFQQYRPPNETYLVGFRAYEQGQNADELERLTPLIREKEREIARLRAQAARALKFEPTGDR